MDILEGDIAHFSAGTYYRPQRNDQSVSFTLQLWVAGISDSFEMRQHTEFGGNKVESKAVWRVVQHRIWHHGEHLSGPKWDSTRDLAVGRLKARGKIEKGVFIDINPVTGERREEDVAQALYHEQYAIHVCSCASDDRLGGERSREQLQRDALRNGCRVEKRRL